MKALIPHDRIQRDILKLAETIPETLYVNALAQIAADGKTINDVDYYTIGGKYDVADPTNNTFWTSTGLFIHDPTNLKATVFAISFSVWYPPSKLNFGFMVTKGGSDVHYPEFTSFFDPWMYPQIKEMVGDLVSAAGTLTPEIHYKSL
jgi:hypothetical protein